MTSSATRNGNAIPGREELVDRAHGLQPLLREYAAKTDAGRCLPDAVNAALTEAGFFRLVTPQRFGGYETSLRTVIEVAETRWRVHGMPPGGKSFPVSRLARKPAPVAGRRG